MEEYNSSMKNVPPLKNKPPYALESVDNALRLVQMLRDQGELRVSQAAEELGIARSTAHRLLAMLVYRDFAQHGASHTYLPGEALSAPPLPSEQARQLREAIAPYAEALRDRTGETVNLMVLQGTQVRFLYSAESDQALRVSNRQGTVLPAWLASGGQALLAELPPAASTGLPEDALPKIEAARRRGYGENVEDTESGVCAVGMCVHGSDGVPHAALAISVPSVRYRSSRVPDLVGDLRETVTEARGCWEYK
jgi:IclR family transcriptional regulator, acetate operon repressor